MHGIRLLLLAVTLAVLGTASSQSELSGKCKNNNIEPVSLDEKLVPGKWNILYVSNLDDDSDLDHAFVHITPTGSNAYNLVKTRVLRNGRPFVRFFTLRFNKNVIISELIDHGKVGRYKMYPLAKTSQNAILFYHCSDTGVFPMDMRFIAIPDGRILSDESLKQLQDVDKSHNFTGNLYKLPYKLS